LDSVTNINNKREDKVLSNGFYSTEDNINNSAFQNTIAAQVHTTQTLVSGGIVKLRLLSDIYINGHLISKNQFVYGVASLSGERLLIDVKTIRSANNIYPVQLKVYDMDGMEGIYVPGAITTDAVKQSADQTIQTLGINSISNSLSVQAASAGIEALKNMVSKKVKLIKVTVKAGYKVLLMNEST
jgi:conjugative transposon TraM protein